MKKVIFLFALLAGLLTSASTLTAQNTNRYITLTVKNGAKIDFKLQTAADGTLVDIISGSDIQKIFVGTRWKAVSCTAKNTRITIFGNVIGLDCRGNYEKLTYVDVSHNMYLLDLDCSGNRLDSLKLPDCIRLQKLNCTNSNLTSLDLSHCTRLNVLYCWKNQLTSLDLSHNTYLTKLDCRENQLTSLDLSHNPYLLNLYCWKNQLTSLDVSHNTWLKRLECAENQITSLDVSENTDLEWLDCYDNPLSTDALDRLYCSLVDRTGRVDGWFHPIEEASSSNAAIVAATNAANATAKNWNVRYRVGGDNVTTYGSYFCPSLNMSRKMTLKVNKTDNAIRLKFRAAADNTPVHIVKGDTKNSINVGTDWKSCLVFLTLFADTTITVYGDVIGFDCSGNKKDQLTFLDVSKNTKLEELICYGNQWLDSLDVSKNTALKKLWCYDNRLSNLDVSHNTQLKELYCYGNPFGGQTLNHIYCKLPDRTGKEAGTILPLDESSSASEVSRVTSTNAANATAKNWKVQTRKSDGNHTDVATTGSYVCPSLNMLRKITLTVADEAAIRLDFKAADEYTPIRIVSGNIDTTIRVGTEWIGTETYIADGTTMTVYGDVIGFDCSGNEDKITALNASNNTQLNELRCSNNGLSSLNVSNNTQLQFLYCFSSGLSSLDVSNCTRLKDLDCFDNQLESLDVSNCTRLTKLDCSYNLLESLDLPQSIHLTTLYCGSNRLGSLDVSANAYLRELSCSSNALGSLDLSQNTSLMLLDCSSNDLSSLDLSVSTYLKRLDCSSNQLSSLDVSNNMQLEQLVCHNNQLPTDALDRIYCSLPYRVGKEAGKIYPIYQASSPGADTVAASNTRNANAKNWKVLYDNNDRDVVTSGSYVCPLPEPNMDRYISLTVTKDSAIRLNLSAAAPGTPVRIVSGSRDTTITVGTGWIDSRHRTADTEMKVYGNVVGFDCENNGDNITAIDLSNNTQLTDLRCSANKLTSLDVSNNNLLTILRCYSNQLSSLDVSANTQLKVLSCGSNQLSSLDVSANTQLTLLGCSANRLTSLDVSANTQLEGVSCSSNRFSTEAIDLLYCSLPNRTGVEAGEIYPLDEDLSTTDEGAIVKATNASNANAKNWKVWRSSEEWGPSDITTTGSYVCPTPVGIASATAAEPLALYPNPAGDELHLTATVREVRIYNMYGVEVARVADTDKVEVSHLPAGIYAVRADGTVLKMVKR